MDLRIRKTKSSILAAFIELRKIKPLEKISVKELADKALINKATFYLHYQDIYDLEDVIEKEMIQEIIEFIGQHNLNIHDFQSTCETILESFYNQGEKLRILTAGSHSAHFVDELEKQLKEEIKKQDTNFDGNIKMDIHVSFLLRGTYYTYMNYDEDTIRNEIIVLFDKNK